MEPLYFVFGWGAPVAAALFAVFLIRSINNRDPGSDEMQRIAALIRSGAMAFLRTEYSVLAGFVAVMFIILVLFLPQTALLTGVSFLVGAVLSATAGWIGMRTATGAGVRTTQAAKTSLAAALGVAFSSGAVMGLTVVALGTLGISVLYFAFGGLDDNGRTAIEALFGLLAWRVIDRPVRACGGWHLHQGGRRGWGLVGEGGGRDSRGRSAQSCDDCG